MTGVAAEEPQMYKNTHKHSHTKEKNILQVALMIKSNVASFTLSAQTFMR